jgi:exopolyphosphatase/guanosine-5'-triphosphate,3'-diphosphate pyrophosphatase
MDRYATSQPIYAALDLGTNNCRLLIAAQRHSSTEEFALNVIDSYSRIVRLGEGVSETGRFSEEAIDRTIEALRQCKRKLEKHSIQAARFIATEACRQASNTPQFLMRVERETGLKIEVISAADEANLAFRGCVSLVKPQPSRALMLDIGGGSTEFMWVEVDDRHKAPSTLPVVSHKVLDWFSMPHGVMNLSEKFGGAQFAEVYFEEMVDYLEQQLLKFRRYEEIAEAVKDNQVQLFSTSGTVTTLAAIYLGLPRYERSKIDGITIEVSQLQQAISSILDMRASERFHHPCIGSDRSDYIISGCAIFEALCRLCPVKHITIADRGVREGIIFSLVADEAEQDYTQDNTAS